MTLDLDQLEAAANRMKSARSAAREGAVSIRALNAAKQEYDDASEPDILLALIAEVRALREDVQAAKLLAHANGEMFKAEKAENEALRRQSFELLGVVIDVEQGGGFDDACLSTIKRVMNVLAGKEKA